MVNASPDLWKFDFVNMNLWIVGQCVTTKPIFALKYLNDFTKKKHNKNQPLCVFKIAISYKSNL